MIPLFGLPDEMVRLPVEPGAMEKVATPVGVEVKVRLFTVSAASRVVAKLVPVVLLALKMRLSKAEGAAVASMAPAESCAQFVARFQDAPVAPLK